MGVVFIMNQDPVLHHGWRTGAIIPELEVCGSLLYIGHAPLECVTVFCWLADLTDTKFILCSH